MWCRLFGLEDGENKAAEPTRDKLRDDHEHVVDAEDRATLVTNGG